MCDEPTPAAAADQEAPAEAALESAQPPEDQTPDAPPEEPLPGDFTTGDPVLFIDEKDRQTMLLVPLPLESVNLKGENYTGAQLCALHDGELLITRRRKRFLVFRPTLRDIIMNMPREAQVIYPKDLGMLLTWADIAPGQTVVEIGTGHGALTMALLRVLGPTGRLVSFDIRQDHLNRTKKNIAQYLGEAALETWTPILADPVTEEVEAPPADRLISDMPEPWTLLATVARLLKPGGVWASWLPTVLQLANLVESIKKDPGFCLPECFETLQRFWQVNPPSVRPTHDMKAHTGFLITCRRRWRRETAPEELPA
ncbi:MAG: methyltransferase domain-containing protein [Deltaproteobacteria bacterium]|nr:methyltransferase domain-containing protein [Deltaproteobacteria bacterium]